MKFLKDDEEPKVKQDEDKSAKETSEEREERKDMSPAELFLDDVVKKELDYEVKRGFMSSELKQCI